MFDFYLITLSFAAKISNKSLLSGKAKSLSAMRKREFYWCWSTILYPCLRQAGATRKILRRRFSIV